MNTTQSPIAFLPGAQRGRTRLGWLDSRHSFSFGRYQDPRKMGYGALRVINDDRILPGAGFGEHGHDNMEILTWVLEGSLRHGDSLDNSQRLVPGELQAMSAGSGIRHSEFNGSSSESARFLQIWIEPAQRDMPPRYDQRAFAPEGRRNQWQVLATGDPSPSADALPIGQDATMRVVDLDPHAAIELVVKQGRRAYIHVVTGSVRIDGQRLEEGDALAMASAGALTMKAEAAAQVLWFDLR